MIIVFCACHAFCETDCKKPAKQLAGAVVIVPLTAAAVWLCLEIFFDGNGLCIFEPVCVEGGVSVDANQEIGVPGTGKSRAVGALLRMSALRTWLFCYRVSEQF
jgi:hypothetical protein